LTHRENIPRIPAYRNAEPGWLQGIEAAFEHPGYCMREKIKVDTSSGHHFLVEKRSRGDLAVSWGIILERNPI